MKVTGKILSFLLSVLLCAACEKPVTTDAEATATVTNENGDKVIPEGTPNTKKFTFTMKGDFSDQWKINTTGDLTEADADEAASRTRGYLQADGKDMTDVWVLDYMGGVLIQQLHQSDNTAEDFGKPVLNLSYGSHHVYFIASRGSGAVLNTDAHTIAYSKVLDTFCKDYEVTVVSTSNGNRAVTLDRVVSRLRLTFTDAVASDVATIAITPAVWYYGFNYQTGQPCDARSNQPVSITIPASELGKTGLQANVYGFSTAEEWTTDITISSLATDGNTIGTATLHNVPLVANRITEYSGAIFTKQGTTSIGLNSEWGEPIYGSW